ncbi:unnamed protein product [Polarella glacialis]|uniref:Uncharacterized protein n=1 Tax=Polarella glacialis TaxID=89957 RepID=A0A813KUL0_POLGL|nr:unnamed protein product [Polarella glacialis]
MGLSAAGIDLVLSPVIRVMLTMAQVLVAGEGVRWSGLGLPRLWYRFGPGISHLVLVEPQVFSTILGGAVREVNSDGDMQCTAEACPSVLALHRWGGCGEVDRRVFFWSTHPEAPAATDRCRSQLPVASQGQAMKRHSELHHIVISGSAGARKLILAAKAMFQSSDFAFWRRWMVVMSRRWDTSVIPQVMARTASPEEQLDMPALSPWKAKRHYAIPLTCGMGFMATAHPSATLASTVSLAPNAPLRVLGVRSGQSADDWLSTNLGKAPDLQIGSSSFTHLRYTFRVAFTLNSFEKSLGNWHCDSSDLSTLPVREMFVKLLSFNVCAVNALAEQMDGTGVAWWPPKRGEAWPALNVWRFFTYTFFHLQFLDLFHNLLTLLDTLDVEVALKRISVPVCCLFSLAPKSLQSAELPTGREGTPSIILGDGSNLKCGVGAKQNFMCYPSIGRMTSTWVKFGDVVTGSSSLGFGLSGAIVALYALYAGLRHSNFEAADCADLDKTTSVQRSFQDWVWLRLIFVAFHIAMEWIRGLSQRDAAGLFAHTASFAAGFTYVLYFLPPMGDGTLLAADRPYVVPCAYDQHEGGGAIGNVPECIRLFSAVYEYQVDYVARNAFLLFVATIGFTVFNTVVLQRRVRSSEAVLLAGMEVSAVCCAKRQGGSSAALPSNMEGKDIIVWCEVVGVTGLQPPQGSTEWDQQLEARCIGADPRREPGALLGAAAEAEARTRPLTGGDSPEFKESVFLPVKYQSKSSFVQLVLYDLSQVPKVAVGFAAIPLSQALRFNKRDYSEQKLKLQAVDANRSTIGVSRAKVHVRFRCLEIAQLQRLRRSVKEQIDDGKFKLDYFEQQLAALRQMSLTDAAGGLPADS